MSLLLSGIGTAVPRYWASQQEAADAASPFCCETDSQREWMRDVYLRTRIRKRHSVLLENAGPGSTGRHSFYPPSTGPADRGPRTLARMERYEREAAPLTSEACHKALEAAGLPARDITHLVSISCTGFCSPGFDLEVIRELGLPAGVSRTHVGFMGCHAALNGLRVARAYAESDPNARVLLCAVELCSLHHQYGYRPEQIVTNALFADGAAAVVARRSSGREGRGWSLVRQGSQIVPNSADAMTWRIGDHGFQMTLSPEVPELICRNAQAFIGPWLAESGLEVAEVESWAIHPGGPRILSVCGEALRLEPEKFAASQYVLAEYGNMSSPTILFILQRLQLEKAPLPCVALAFGPGLTMEAALFA